MVSFPTNYVVRAKTTKLKILKITRMKLSHLSYALIALMISACSQTEVLEPQDESQSSASIRTEKEAIEIAEGLPAIFDNESRSSKSCVSVVKIHDRARGSEQSTIYAVNYADGEGYALIAASKSVDPFLAYVEKGSYSENTQNAGLIEFIDAAQAYIDEQPDGVSIGDSALTVPRESITTSILTRTYTNWGQDYPEGTHCMNLKCGCVQTAQAIMLAYLKSISSIDLTYDGHEVDVLNLNWDEICRHTQSSSNITEHSHISCNASGEAHQTLSRLCRELGQRNNARYILGDILRKKTTTDHFFARNRFAELIPNEITEYVDFETGGALYDLLSERQCIACISTSTNTWIVDGAKRTTTTSEMPKYDGTVEISVTNKYAYHYNWGCNGEDNGYFTDGVFKKNPYPSRGIGDAGGIVEDPDKYAKYFIVYK